MDNKELDLSKKTMYFICVHETSAEKFASELQRIVSNTQQTGYTIKDIDYKPIATNATTHYTALITYYIK